ncbi:ARM repeat-containing protein [Schizopora paradoxa]|uniref:ARM repeat-containing protein n=1 Tax=Schizopora paradoxa TaxID=27342 RepID=A0A0H2RRA7_9AGAM|nr:ARM repeat-containing protein [Schizopora paradoxa]
MYEVQFSVSSSRPADYKRVCGFKQDYLDRRQEQKKQEETLWKRKNLLPASEADSDERAGSEPYEANNRDPDGQLDATIKFRKSSSKEKNPPVEDVIERGVVTRFFVTARTLTNSTSDAAEHTQVIDHQHPCRSIIHCASVTSSVTSSPRHSPACRDYVLQHGASQLLLMLMGNSIKKRNFCRGKTPQPDRELLIYSLDNKVLIDACWAILYLSDGSNDLDKIQALLQHNSTSVQTQALRSVGNIVTGDDLQTQVVIASGALTALLALLSSPKDSIREEAKEACWTISNATSGGLQEPSQIRYLPLLQTMDNKITQRWTSKNAGPGAANQYTRFVEECGEMRTIHNLQTHDNMEIYKKSFSIMDKYFTDEEEVTNVAAPNVDASGNFAFQNVSVPQGGLSSGQQ